MKRKRVWGSRGLGQAGPENLVPIAAQLIGNLREEEMTV